VLVQEPPAGKASLSLVGLQRVKLPATSSEGFLNIEFKNQGTLDADKFTLLAGALTTVRELTPEAVKQHLDAATAALDKINSKDETNQLRIGNNPINPHAISDPDQWGELGRMPGITLSDAQWQDFEQAKLAIYVFYVARYKDDGHKGSFWKTGYQWRSVV
jgi:hypothetical protein